MENQKIREKLTNNRDEYLNAFNSISNPDKLLKDLFKDLENFNFETYKIKLKKEIEKNLKEWWTNSKIGIKNDEGLFGILFEFDSYYYMKNVEATAYGINKWENFKVYADEFDMGYDYDFATEFYALPGITLNFLDSLNKLDDKKLSENYKQVTDLSDIEGHFELMELYKFEGFIAIHQVLTDLNKIGAFEVLNYKNGFMFMIGEHDSGEVYPLLIKKHSGKDIIIEKTNYLNDEFEKELEKLKSEIIFSSDYRKKKTIVWAVRTLFAIILYFIFWKYKWVRLSLFIYVPLNVFGLLSIYGWNYFLNKKLSKIKQKIDNSGL